MVLNVGPPGKIPSGQLSVFRVVDSAITVPVTDWDCHLKHQGIREGEEEGL